MGETIMKGRKLVVLSTFIMAVICGLTYWMYTKTGYAMYFYIYVFKEMSHNKINKLEAWLYFIGSDSPKDICRVIEAFPEFKELYNELLMLRYKTKELVNMFDVIREALRAADEGTVKYMVEEKQKEIAEQKKTIAEQSAQLAERDEQLAERDEQLAEKNEKLEYQKKENERLMALLQQANIKVD